MEQIACILGETYIYWSAVVKTLAVAAGICTFLALYLDGTKSILAGAVGVPVGLFLSLALARLAHWYFRPDGYGDADLAMILLGPGGYALMGAFGGCLLTAVLLRLVRLSDNLTRLLDCMSLAGCLAIALGRLSFFFNTADRGLLMTGSWGLPWADTVINPVSGQGACRFATFLLQAMAAGGIFLALLIHDFLARRKYRKADTCLLFLLLYASSQVVLDSTRYDALYFRSNGFVSVVQVLGACGIVLTSVVFAVRMARAALWRKWYPLLWLAQIACLTLAGYMEYYVQRHGSEALFAYSVMSGALVGNLVITLLTRNVAAAWRMQYSLNEKGGIAG